MSDRSRFHTRIRRIDLLATMTATKPRKQASQARSRATVDALVEATARILVDEGFDKASTNRIAERAGVSVGSLYQYFPSKEALVLAVAERHNREIMQVVSEALDELVSLQVEAAVRRLVGVAIDGHRVNPELHRVLAEEVPRTGDLDGLRDVNENAGRRFRRYLEEHRDEVAVEDLDLAAFICATSIESLTHNAVLHRPELCSDDTVERLTEEASRLIVAYLKGGRG
jgi:AcrR family transcriptional regulator